MHWGPAKTTCCHMVSVSIWIVRLGQAGKVPSGPTQPPIYGVLIKMSNHTKCPWKYQESQPYKPGVSSLSGGMQCGTRSRSIATPIPPSLLPKRNSSIPETPCPAQSRCNERHTCNANNFPFPRHWQWVEDINSGQVARA